MATVNAAFVVYEEFAINTTHSDHTQEYRREIHVDLVNKMTRETLTKGARSCENQGTYPAQ